MDIRINSMILQNFKGIKYLETNANGESLSIYGDNATGKTTVFDAFTWLLFNKDSLGRTDFGIKTQDENGNPIHNLEHSVECELAIDNSILTLKKIFSEKWTKKRGSAEAEFTGHETKYFVNEVPVPKKDYEAKITSIIDETLFKIITNPLYFNEHMKWQERRSILLNLCENITDEDILANNDQFAPLSAELKGRTVQEYKKIVQSKQSAINDNLKSIPGRIAEACLAIPEAVANVDESERAEIEKKIADLNDEILAIKNGVAVNTELIALKTRKAEIMNRVCCDDLELRKELDECYNEANTISAEIRNCKGKIGMYFDAIQEAEKKLEALRNEWQSVNNEEFVDMGKCPTCGQEFPAEQIEKAKEIFNLSKVQRLEEINTKGKEWSRDKDEDIQKHDTLSEKLKNLQDKKAKVDIEIIRLNKAISDAEKAFKDKKQTELDEINSRIAEVEKSEQSATESIQVRINPIQEQINAERAKIAEIDKAIANRDLAERQRARISELEADEKRLAGEYAELDKMSFLIDEFIKHKVEILSGEINSHFRFAKFKLFDVQINGGIAECCEVCYKGVPYADLNNAARINVGLDIINTLCKLNDRFAPIIVDNSESVTNIIPTTSQMICLVVSAEDDMLRVEKGV